MKTVESLSVDDILDKASSGYFQIPQFQREFVWNNSQISSLVESALQGLPCGAIVTWENPDTLTINDYHNVRLEEVVSKKKNYVDFPPKGKTHNQPFIVIDGLQRITAICVAFGSLHNKNATYRLGGKFFINIDAPEIVGSISFKKLTTIQKEGLEDPETWKQTGLFPLNDCTRPLKKETQRSNSSYWTSVVTPLVAQDPNRLKRVDEIRNKIGMPIMAEMPLESYHSLSDIADSFELLNTQGTPVSMVDIIHSTLYEWFKTNKNKNWELRDWIENIYEDKISRGWGRASKRQIILQFGVATELVSTSRKASRKGQNNIPENIRNKDILSLNEGHWFELEQNTKLFKECIYNFQIAVLGKQFPEIDCPYPISASIYIALYWKLKREKPQWTKKRLNQIFSAFFWSNALSQGYETDSLKVPKDLFKIEELLNDNVNSDDKIWKAAVDSWLTQEVKIDFPTSVDMKTMLLGKASGAMRQTLQLPIKYKPKNDLVNINANISFPNNNVEMHHIFPRKWINDNQNMNAFGSWHTDIEKIKELRECLANKTPLLDTSNNNWRSQSPQTALSGFNSSGQNKNKPIWKDRFISDSTYDCLRADKARDFLEFRADEIEQWLSARCELEL